MPDRYFRRFRVNPESSETETLYSIRESDLREMLDEALETVQVDQEWYLSNYEDVREAIHNGEFSSAKDHYKRFGYFEGRFPFDIKVDTRWYVENYRDVASAIRQGIYPDAQSHFDQDGYVEGRIPYEGFKLFGTAKERRNMRLVFQNR